MLPMIPMPFLPGAFLEGISGCTPLPCGRLPGEDEAGHACPSQLFGLGRDVLTTAPLRVQRLLHIVVELADRDRLVMMLVPPDREQVGDGLSAPVPLLRLADCAQRGPDSPVPAAGHAPTGTTARNCRVRGRT